MAAAIGAPKGGAWRPAAAPGSRPGPYGAAQANGGAGEEITTLWVGDLPAETTDDELLTGFVMYGNVKSAKVGFRPAASGMRSGFVRYETRLEADEALHLAASGMLVVLGQAVTCQWARQNSNGGKSGGKGGKGGGGAIENSYAAAPVQAAWLEDFGASEQALGSQGYAAVGQGAPAGQRWGGGAGMGQAPMGQAPMAQPIIEDQMCTLWLGNMVEGTTNDDVAQAFGSLGQVVHGSVSRKPSQLGSYSGFVRYASRADAEQALTLCSSGQLLVNGSAVVARWSKTNSKIMPELTAGMQAAEQPFEQPFEQPYEQPVEQPVAQPVAQQPSYGQQPQRSSDWNDGYAAGLADAAAQLGITGVQLQALEGLRQLQCGLNSSGGGFGGGSLGQAGGASSYAGSASTYAGGTSGYAGGGGGPARPAPATGQGPVRTLFIGSLPMGATQEELAAAFAEMGIEGAITMNKPGARGLSGFIRFPTNEIAQQAFEFLCATPMELGGQQLVFDWAKSDTRGGE